MQGAGSFCFLMRYPCCALQGRSITYSPIVVATKINYEAEGSIKYEWGRKDGNKVSAGASAQIKDEKGNYVKAQVDHNNKGQGSAEISAGCKNDKD
jgi:hypothetical protein